MVKRAREAAAVAAMHAARHDREGTFPEEGLEVLAENGYLAAVLPRQDGGEGAGVAAHVLGHLELAKGDASLALVVAMHCALLGRVHAAAQWPANVFSMVAREVATRRAGRGALINSLSSEPETGSPARGAMPITRAERSPTGWILRGRKSFSSGSAVLRWGLVSATVTEGRRPRAANFLVPMDSPGLRVEPSWDSLGMRATTSHTLVLDGVPVPTESELPRPQPGMGEGPTVPHERAWSLQVATVYLGAAEAARDAAVSYARERRPSGLGGKPIATLAQIRQRVGALDARLYAARGLLVSVARAWDAADVETRTGMDGALAAAKLHISNAAVAIAEGAMRVVGGSSLDRALPLERHFRDVRGGLHHPPQDDVTLELLAHEALD